VATGQARRSRSRGTTAWAGPRCGGVRAWIEVGATEPAPGRGRTHEHGAMERPEGRVGRPRPAPRRRGLTGESLLFRLLSDVAGRIPASLGASRTRARPDQARARGCCRFRRPGMPLGRWSRRHPRVSSRSEARSVLKRTRALLSRSPQGLAQRLSARPCREVQRRRAARGAQVRHADGDSLPAPPSVWPALRRLTLATPKA
jgi:hypothetical protein